MTIARINPTTGEALEPLNEMTGPEIDRIVVQCAAAFEKWRETSFAERAAILRKVAERLRERKISLAELMAREMGKPITQGRAEIDKCALGCEYYAEHGEKFLAAEPIPTDARKSAVGFEPLGTLLAIMPWNFPFWQVFRAAAPALMAGNGVLLKHASNVFGSALAIEDLFHSGGLPKELFRALLIGSKEASGLIAHPLVQAVTLTGSVPAGKAVAAQSGAVLKKSVLELGGSDAYVILEDADLEPAAEACVTSRLINTGQSCIAAKRFIVVEPVRREFEELVLEKMRKRQTGDPLKETTTLGPLARHDLRATLHDQVQRSVAKGAKLALGGEVPTGKGAFYPPTVLTNVAPGNPAFDEETFGPVAAIVSARSEEQAIELANHSPFGLGAAVFTRDLERGERIAAKQLQAGCCFVNDYVRSDPRLPFGGIKESGFGRELAIFGIREFVNVKTFWVR